MSSRFKFVGRDIPEKIVEEGRRVGSATADWADRRARKVRRRVRDTAEDADEYVRDHPAPFVAAACVVSFAAGFILSRAFRRR